MAVLARSWRHTVTLIKLVDRKAGQAQRAAPKQVDLTPYLGDGGVVRTTKAIGAPAGAFSIVIPDQVQSSIKDTAYALVEPMDLIEIRAAEHPEKYAGQPLPLIMRGFVSSVERPESIDADGAPLRQVVIRGQDMGKMWLIHQVLFQLGYTSDSPYLTTFQLQALTGMEVAVLPVSDYMTQVVKIMNGKVDMLSAYTSQQIKHFLANCSVKTGQVAPGMVGQYEGTIWGLAERFADRPWNEMWIEDREFGPVFNFRPVPFKDIDGKFIMAGAIDPGTIEIDIDAVITHAAARSDSNIANFFWVPPGDSSLTTNQYSSVAALIAGTPQDFAYANNKPELYGVKKMEVQSSLLGDNLATVPSLAPAGEQQAAGQAQVEWNIKRANDLKAMNRDNGVFEAIEMTLRGSETFKVGQYLQLTRGQLVSESYLVAVAHTFTPLGLWTTSASCIRGTGFLERNKLTGSPYWLEGRKGPYSPVSSPAGATSPGRAAPGGTAP